MEKKDKLFISIYNDFYGNLLTDYQRGLVDGYYNLDMSLSELAEEHNISPQGVRDALKRAEKQLIAYEQKLGLVKKTNQIKSILEELKQISTPDQQQKISEAIDLLVD